MCQWMNMSNNCKYILWVKQHTDIGGQYSVKYWISQLLFKLPTDFSWISDFKWGVRSPDALLIMGLWLQNVESSQRTQWKWQQRGILCVHSSSWTLSDGGKSPLKSNCLFVSLTVFLKNIVGFFTETFITNKLKGCPCPGEGVRIHAPAIEADNPALQCQEAMASSLTHKNNFIFLGRGSLLSLLPFCPCRFSVGVPDPCAEWRDETGFPELQRGGRGGWSELSTLEVRLCSQSQSPAPLLCYCPTYLRLGQPGEDLLHMWCFLTHMLNSSKMCYTIRCLQYNYTRGQLGPTHLNISFMFLLYSSMSRGLYPYKYQNFLRFLSYFSLLLANPLESFALCVVELFLCSLSLAATGIPFLFVFQVSILKKGK